ncbi:hypothetical protein ACT8ZS_02650 [Paenibacillus sp. M.A.Huq-84]
MDPVKIEVKLRNGDEITYKGDHDEKALIKWLKKLGFDHIAEIEFKYADGVEVKIKLPHGDC